MRLVRACPLLCAVVLSASACTPAAQTVTFRSLESSGTAAFVCLSTFLSASGELEVAENGNRSIKDCPDNDPVDGETRQTFALVTQTTRGEVAVVGIGAADTETGKALSGFVVDEEPSVPGFNFLPVGAAPTDIVATPGSAAAFVASAEVGKEGIYTLPTSCALGRIKDAARAGRDGGTPLHAAVVRDITQWPACHLTSAPGRMAVLVDPPAADGAIRSSCNEPKSEPEGGLTSGGLAEGGLSDGGARADAAHLEPEAAARSSNAQGDGRACQARIDEEPSPPGREGRRKLVVSLPDEGRLVVIDAQTLADRRPGSFDPCPIEAEEKLNGVITPIQPILQKLPSDLNNVFPGGFPHPPPKQGGYDPRPAGFARIDDSTEHKLFIADSDAPMIHVLDTADPCHIAELPPLLPVSYFEPSRIVTTTKVAVMDHLTTGGQRFLYAIDQLGGGQVMAFDVSPNSTERTPIVRKNSPRTPFEAPDRIALTPAAVDVAFVTENPARSPDSATGTESFVKCDPTPISTSQGTKYQPTIPDYSSGANPSRLRGTFGLIELSNGQIAVIDEEDLDQPCRRPVTPNSSKAKDLQGNFLSDFRGCPGGDRTSFYTKNGKDPTVSTPTVTEEASCTIVEPHRARSANLVIDDANLGVHAPALATLPKLADQNGRGLLADSSPAGRVNPRMLGVNFENFPAVPGNHAQVYVGTDLFEVDVDTSDHSTPQNQLFIDPTDQHTKTNSVVLNLEEPRAHLSDATFTATFEGKLFADRPAGVLTHDDKQGWLLRDTAVSGGFCAQGVESIDVARSRALASEKDATKNLGVTDVEGFAQEYADYAVITADLLPNTDPYWQGRGASCVRAHASNAGEGYINCRVYVGNADPQSLSPIRELTIKKATRDTLTVLPRNPDNQTNVDTVMKNLSCCFPEPFSYTVRASREWLVAGDGAQHEVTTGSAPDFACIRDDNPLFQHLATRAFEVSCGPNSAACLSADGKPWVGPDPANPPASPPRACIIQNPKTDVQTIGAGPVPGCIFTSLTSNFVIYAGLSPSQRDMQFTWEVGGGFTPLLINVSVPSDPTTALRSLLPSPFPGTVIATDGGDKGLVIVDLTTFAPFSIF